MSSRKRKHGPEDLDNGLLHIQAYEADIRCSPTSARSLEANGLHIGEALINHSTLANAEIWLDRCVRPSVLSLRTLHVRTPAPGTVTDILVTPHLVCCSVFLFCIFSFCHLGGTPLTLLTIRYDARLILDPDLLSTHLEIRRSSSPSGWSDIPSDAEDTFFFSQAEVDDYRRDKRRRLIDSAREERLRILAQLEPADEPQETCWASDEEVSGV